MVCGCGLFCQTHWSRNVTILTKFSSQASPKFSFGLKLRDEVTKTTWRYDSSVVIAANKTLLLFSKKVFRLVNTKLLTRTFSGSVTTLTYDSKSVWKSRAAHALLKLSGFRCAGRIQHYADDTPQHLKQRGRQQMKNNDCLIFLNEHDRWQRRLIVVMFPKIDVRNKFRSIHTS